MLLAVGRRKRNSRVAMEEREPVRCRSRNGRCTGRSRLGPQFPPIDQETTRGSAEVRASGAPLTALDVLERNRKLGAVLPASKCSVVSNHLAGVLDLPGGNVANELGELD